MLRSSLDGNPRVCGANGCWACAAILAFISAGGCGVASNGLNAQGTRYFQSGQQQAAINDFQQAVAADPTNADSYYNLGAVCHSAATVTHDATKYSQAEHYYHQCLDYDANHVECYRALAVLLVEQNRKDEALRLLQDWAKRSPTSADARVELARLNQEFGNRTEAEKQLQEAITIDTRNSRARAALGKIQEEKGEYAQALNNYNSSLEANSVQPQLAARVAALSATASPAPTTAPDATRTVATPQQPTFR